MDIQLGLTTVAPMEAANARPVLMVDDHVMFLQGLKNLLSVLVPDLRVDTCGDLAQAAQFVLLTRYDLVLLDWHLAECDGAISLLRLREAGCMSRIVVLSGETSVGLIRACIEKGAAGFIPKTYSSEMMVAALGKVLDGQIFVPAEALHASGTNAGGTTAPAREGQFAGLTARQIEVYRAATRGLPNKLIARELGIAESTVKSHLTAVFSALGVSNRTEAAYQASRDGTRIS
ncbi:response regulator [Piscinibacter terrae]|uniref:response regulator n=1 Tax=Piscinibacter terrae TaxID=2496871 RepID=UPI0013866E6F|nr:response regulator transcription factor [Albitalea terrae]